MASPSSALGKPWARGPRGEYADELRTCSGKVALALLVDLFGAGRCVGLTLKAIGAHPIDFARLLQELALTVFWWRGPDGKGQEGVMVTVHDERGRPNRVHVYPKATAPRRTWV